MIKDNFQFLGSPRLIQEIHGKVLAQVSDVFIFQLELVLQAAHTFELPAQLEGGQDGVLAGEGDEGRTRQCAVGINT